MGRKSELLLLILVPYDMINHSALIHNLQCIVRGGMFLKIIIELLSDIQQHVGADNF